MTIVRIFYYISNNSKVWMDLWAGGCKKHLPVLIMWADFKIAGGATLKVESQEESFCIKVRAGDCIKLVLWQKSKF